VVVLGFEFRASRFQGRQLYCLSHYSSISILFSKEKEEEEEEESGDLLSKKKKKAGSWLSDRVPA
jgi:hypothetical protein